MKESECRAKDTGLPRVGKGAVWFPAACLLFDFNRCRRKVRTPSIGGCFFTRPVLPDCAPECFAPCGERPGASPLALCPNGAMPLRVLRTWATPSPLKRAALNFPPYAHLCLS